ncbi:endolytic transglycosylase MltG [Gorillibacterium sp. sgz5001074]|uniref:endolytic transglycosylase MltG n=1 Tax=Gorillibacterium sp. sgz5001074 TaxID=3446695 RepID=UPI003F667B89
MEKDVYEEAPPKRRIWKRVLGILGILLFLAAAAAGAGVYYLNREMQPTAPGETVRVTIPQGTGSAGIASLLHHEGIIRQEWAFMLYLKYKNEGTRFQAGVYELTPGMTQGEIVAKLNRGDVVKEEMLRFTIPEGYTVSQIADKLSQEGIAAKDRFLTLADSPPAGTAPRTEGIPANGSYKHRLEGYLFPETYEMKKGSTEEEILNRMLGEWDKKLKLLPEGWEAQLEKRGLTFHQLLTVASLIEREVAADEERALVAGVIYNRIQQKMPLQIDATIQYLFDKPKERIFEKDLQIESPYNTYLHPGLPPGPIASPGLPSVKAALWPETTPYLFYVTKKDGSGKHLFAETFEEHKKNIANSSKNP